MKDLIADMAPIEGHELGACRDAFYGGIESLGRVGHSGSDPRFVYGLIDEVGLALWRINSHHETETELNPEAVY